MNPKVQQYGNSIVGDYAYASCSVVGEPFVITSASPAGYYSRLNRPAFLGGYRCEYCGLWYSSFQTKCDQGCGAPIGRKA